MKRVGHLYEQFVTFENLLKAYRKARKATGKSREAQEFAFRLEPELLCLQRELQAGTWTPSPYRYFTIYEPKRRTISAAAFRDRVVHHALIQVIEPVFDPTFIHHSYATRKEKGVHVAREHAQRLMRRFPYYLKVDVDGYFASIHHEILCSLLNRKIKDARLMALMRRIIEAPNPDQVGLPIGNLTSQFFGNVYLNPLDHHLCDELGCRGYLRYMDDMLVFSRDRKALKGYLKAMTAFTQEQLKLELKARATLFGSSQDGLPFLGARIFRKTIRIKRENFQRTKRRLKQAYAQYLAGTLTEEAYQASLNGHMACLKQYDSLGLRQQLMPQLFVPKEEKF